MNDSSTITTAILKLEAAAYAVQLRHFGSAVQLLAEAEALARAARYVLEHQHQQHAQEAHHHGG